MTQDLIDRIWKQPIPTNLNTIFGKSFLSKHIYIELLLRSRNSNERPEEKFAGKFHFLQRSQCVCGYKELANEFGVDHKTVCKALKKLQNVYHRVELKTTNKGTVVTITNYDDVVKMERKTENNGNSKGTQSPPNKSDESVESDKDITPVPTKRASKCPNTKEGHSGCVEFIDGISEEFKNGQKFINYAKQIKFLHSMIRAGYGFETINKALNSVDRDRFLGNNWDLATVAGYLDRKGGEQK